MIQMKPMLASNAEGDFTSVNYPMYSSPKVDGIRCLIVEGNLLSRSMKPQPTKALLTHFADLIEYSRENSIVIDGELYDHTKPFCWHQSTFRSFDGKPSRGTRLWVIDSMPLDVWEGRESYGTFTERLFVTRSLSRFPNVKPIEQIPVINATEAQEHYDACVAAGYEGTMLRDPARGYKHGRATAGENWLLKFKLWQDEDAVITDVVEGVKVRDGAEKRVSPTGDSERSHKMSDYEPSGMAGAIKLRTEAGVEFSIGTFTGWTHELRIDMLANKDRYIGRWVRFRSQACGVKDAPRIPHNLTLKDGKPVSSVMFELRDDK
jgi:DNA ligase-1